MSLHRKEISRYKSNQNMINKIKNSFFNKSTEEKKLSSIKL